MWFRNLIVYRVPEGWDVSAQALGEQLSRVAFSPASSIEETSVGWAPPRAADAALVYEVNRQFLLTLRQEKKLLPAKVVTQFVKQRVERIEAEEGFKPGRKRLKELKEEVRDELLPRAFSLASDTHVWIDPVHGWLAIEASSAARADDVITLLVKAIDGFPARRLSVADPVAGAMTTWLVTDEAPAGFTVDQDAELRAREGKATIRYANQALEHDDIERHTKAGKQCTKLALTWSDRVSFVLNDKLELKRVRALDVLKEQSESSDVGEEERFASDFTLMTAELAKLLADVVECLGGLKPGAETGSPQASPPASPPHRPVLAKAPGASHGASAGPDDPPF